MSPAQQRVMDLLTTRGHAVLALHTNEELGTVHSGTARALQDQGLINIWSRKHAIAEAVLPGSARDTDLDNIGT